MLGETLTRLGKVGLFADAYESEFLALESSWCLEIVCSDQVSHEQD